MFRGIVGVALILICAQSCGETVRPPETPLAFSFEHGMEGWAAAAADTGTIGGAHAPWSIEPSTDLAYDGQHSLKFYMANYTDAAKIWIVRSFLATPGRTYTVKVSYAFASADYGQANLFALLTGVFDSPPVDGPGLLAGTTHESTGNGSNSDVGYQWLQKDHSFSAQGSAKGLLYIVVGVWGTWETPRTYFIDDLRVQVTPK